MRTARWTWAGALGLVTLAVVLPLASPWRPTPAESRAPNRLTVTEGSDGGAGSLREAVFAANRADGRAVIEVRVAEIRLTSPLPPLVNPDGVVLTGYGAEPPRIRAEALASGPVLELAAPRSVVRGLRFEGAPGPAILVRAREVEIAANQIEGAEIGILLTEEAVDTRVSRNDLARNTVGIRSGADRPTIESNRVRDSGRAGIWVETREDPESGPRVVANELADQPIGLLLLGASEVLGNDVRGSSEAGIWGSGSGLSVLRNRIRDGAVGIVLDDATGSELRWNEVDHNEAVGILLRGGRRNTVEENRVYANGYGIVTLFGSPEAPDVVEENLVFSQGHDGLYALGGSPILRGNRAYDNRGAGIRLVDYVDREGNQFTSSPLLRDNLLRSNRIFGTPRSTLHAVDEEAANGEGSEGADP